MKKYTLLLLIMCTIAQAADQNTLLANQGATQSVQQKLGTECMMDVAALLLSYSKITDAKDIEKEILQSGKFTKQFKGIGLNGEADCEIAMEIFPSCLVAPTNVVLDDPQAYYTILAFTKQLDSASPISCFIPIKLNAQTSIALQPKMSAISIMTCIHKDRLPELLKQQNSSTQK